MAVRGRGQGAVSAAVSILSLVALVAAGPGPVPPGSMVEQAYPPAALKDFTSADRRFTRTRQGDRWLLSYHFQGISKAHDVSCSIDIEPAQKLIDEFSYRHSEKASVIAADIGAQVRRELPPSLAFYGEPSFSATYDEQNDRINLTRVWRWKEENLLTAYDRDFARSEITRWFDLRKKGFFDRAQANFYRKRGFLWDARQGWVIDYARLVDRATPVLRNCIDAFGKEVARDPELLMMFFQAMPFRPIKDKGTGWGTGGLRPPSSVMLQWEGDCDSKAATFCILHRRYSQGLFILRSPRHALVGVEQYSSTPPAWRNKWPVRELEAIFYKDPVQVENRYFIPCEVAGPASARYGQVALRKVEQGRRDIYREDYLVIPISAGPG